MTETKTMMTDNELSKVIGEVHEALAATIDTLKEALKVTEAPDNKPVSKDTEAPAEKATEPEADEDSDSCSDDDLYQLYIDEEMYPPNFLVIKLDKDTFRIEKQYQIPQELMDPDTEMDFIYIPELKLYMHYDRKHVLKFSDVRYYTGKIFFYDNEECNYCLEPSDYTKLICWLENHITLSTFDSCNWFPVLTIEKGKGLDALGDCDEFDFAV